ncbi:unnamed protein product [Clonostachys rosea]|uniref:AAA+ ATPase domain-containing protein n=1 Tax=Bionectria ochroleuca TaxID=29856 RepID=A0ABY6TMS6_BIOOC|nr:unnamed protein product [Clonostachys rosea]
MEYQGLEEVKLHFLKSDNAKLGRTSIARLYKDLLVSLEIVPPGEIVETSGVELATTGPSAFRDDVKDLLNEDDGGGVLFIDEAYQLLSDFRGRQVLDLILKKMSDKIGRLAIIFAGYKEQMELIFEHNPGLRSRFPHVFNFPNFTAAELWEILIKHVREDYTKMRFEDGDSGTNVQIVIKRLERGSSNLSFGNARAVQNCVRQMVHRQFLRIEKEAHSATKVESTELGSMEKTEMTLQPWPRESALEPQTITATVDHQKLMEDALSVNSSSDDASQYNSSVGCLGKEEQYCLLTRDDILGPPPTQAFQSQAWEELQSLVGLRDVKNSVESLIQSLHCNYHRECQGKSVLQIPLNRVLVGQPGTGKTTVARLYGKILTDLGLLSRGDVVLKTPADFIGSHVGESEEKTSKILEATTGKVLIIDEAYMLDDGEKRDTTNSYKAGVLDTIVAHVQGSPHEDRCILLLGYEDRLCDLFMNMNPGLSRRFQADSPWRFTNFQHDEMREILKRALSKEQLEYTPEAFETASDMLQRASTRPDFANAAEVDHCLANAKINYLHRLSVLPSNERLRDERLLPEDFDPDLRRKQEESADLFSGRLSTEIVEKLTAYERSCRQAKKKGLKNPYIALPILIAFKGSPGTGKRTAASALGQIYYNLGFLASSKVIQKTATDFIGQYVGQTAPKTRNLLQKHLGKVLLVDGAYGLNHEPYGREAQDEIIQFISELSYPRTMVIILVDSVRRMDLLFKDRPSLGAYFEEQLMFQDLLPDDCVVLLERELKALPMLMSGISLQEPMSVPFITLRRAFHTLQQVPDFKNAGDIKSIVKNVVMKISEPGITSMTSRSGDALVIPVEIITRCVHEITQKHRTRDELR